MAKRDTRTPEQILADLKARAAAKIEEDAITNARDMFGAEYLESLRDKPYDDGDDA